MKYTRNVSKRRRMQFKRVLAIEGLETRTLLSAASETFTGPSLSDLITLAESGTDTAPQAINRELTALQTQLTQGPLNDLTSGAVDSSGFVQEVQSMEMSYEQDLSQVLAAFPNVNEILDLGGQAVVADVAALNQEYSVGMLSSSDLTTYAQSAIDSLTAAPIGSLNLALSTYASETQAFESDLNTLAQSLSATASVSLTPSQVSATVLTEADAFFANVSAGLETTHPNIEKTVQNAVNNLESAATALAGDSSSDAQSALTSAIAALDAALLGTDGEFGSDGPIARAESGGRSVAPVHTNAQTNTEMSGVGGVATVGGTATLTATLTSNFTGQGIPGETVDFTLDGVFAGMAVTDSEGVATLSGVATTDGVGTDSGGVVATFSGDSEYRPSDSTGYLAVNQVGTVLTNVSGTASVGGTATLNATLDNGDTGLGIANETIDFTLDGTSVGSAVTNSSGVATLTGVTTSDALGTDTGGVVASFAGDTNNAAATNAAGNLVVSDAATTLSDVSGTASSGSTATLSATLTSQVTGDAIDDEEISFTLDGTSVGSAETDSDGVATLTGVSTSDAVGTDTGGVVATFTGDTTIGYSASTGTGNLVVTSSITVGTTLTDVSGTSTYGSGTATLTATLTDTATGAGISGETIDFTLDNGSVVSGTTNSDGVATATTSTSDAIGTDPNGVVASFAATGNYLAATNVTGNLVVTQATTLASVSGTATYGGTATLTATLTDNATSAGISGEMIDFTLDGTSVGSIATNSDGVATLTNVSTSDAAGTNMNDVVATFAGDLSNLYSAASGTGNLVVSPAGTSITNVSGTSTYGSGTATLFATLISSVTNAPIAGQTVDFTLDDGSVVSGTTNSDGVATATTSTSDAIGTDPNGVVASFTGGGNYLAAANVTGNLVVSS